ncbi:hypothetical protein QSQ03_005167, partial [Escherichia coli]
ASDTSLAAAPAQQNKSTIVRLRSFVCIADDAPEKRVNMSSPEYYSSGKTNRYRLNRGGDRAANSALHIIAIGRLRTDDKTKEYVARRVAEGHTKMEAIRCLKRYISREVYTLLRNQNRQINSIPITA